MHIEIGRFRLVDMLEKRQEFIEIFYNRRRTQVRLNCQSPAAFTRRFPLNQIAA
ncbi:hypothetical protein [Burkholderia ubonensis]|uniref:hypothetical protein n=1 Tax=Burkholderia ubonensis TaxID=101571 RepID=UPI000A4FB0BF|nr:hypothetical protein [Burkholderia ubonensis]